MKHIILLMALALAACGGGDKGGFSPDTNPAQPAAISIAPDSLGDGWTTSTPAAEGIDGDSVLRTLEVIRDGNYPGVDSMIVIRHGRLVAEGYFGGYAHDSLHDLRSTGKSFTSALAGIAVSQGLMDTDEPLSQLIPQYENHANMDDRKRTITVRHLLNMSSSLDCNDWDPGSPGNEERMYNRQDWVKFILDLPMVQAPGAVSSYCTGGVVVLGDAITERAGMGLDRYADTWLFGPLGIHTVEWRRSPNGDATGGGGLKLRPRDAAKLGQLYLNGGTWNGARILPSAWTDESQRVVTRLGSDGYGFLWWKRAFTHRTGNVEAFFTSGNGGNFIYVLPALDLVVVFTGSNYNSPAMDQPFSIMNSRLLPSVQ